MRTWCSLHSGTKSAFEPKFFQYIMCQKYGFKWKIILTSLTYSSMQSIYKLIRLLGHTVPCDNVTRGAGKYTNIYLLGWPRIESNEYNRGPELFVNANWQLRMVTIYDHCVCSSVQTMEENLSGKILYNYFILFLICCCLIVFYYVIMKVASTLKVVFHVMML